MNVRRRGRLPKISAAFVLTGLALSGCGSSGTGGGGSGGFLSSVFNRSPQAIPAAMSPAPGQKAVVAANAPTPAPRCPEVEIRSGMQTIAVHAGESIPANLRYQVTIGDLARECYRTDAAGMVKLGVAGRVVLGPKGAPGNYAVPLRISVLRGGVDQVYTTLARVPVAVAAGQSSASFAHVAENVTFPLEPGDRLTRYRIYVGFEGQARR